MFFKEFTDLLNPISRRIIFGVLLNFVGSGMTLSLLLVYLHDMRGFTNTFGGLLLAGGAAAGLAVGGPIGALIDHIGPKIVAMAGLILCTVGVFSFSLVTTHFHAAIAQVLFSMGSSCIWPAQTVMLARVTPVADRQKIFGFNFMILNLGFAIGGFIGSIIIQEGSLKSFQIMYWVDAATFLIYLLVILSIKSDLIGKYIAPQHEPQSGSYRELFKIKEIILLAFSGVVLLTFGYGALQAGIPIFATQYLGLSPKWLGVIFGVNTISIVVMQPFILRILERVSKYMALVCVGLIWALSWIFVGVAPYLSLIAAGIALCVSQLIFALGETIWSPTMPTLANEISPEHIRGRANALIGMQWGVAGVLGPSITGLMLGAHLEGQWVVVMTLGALLPIPLFLQLKKLGRRRIAGA